MARKILSSVLIISMIFVLAACRNEQAAEETSAMSLTETNNMEYRILPHGGEKISIIGMGSSVIGERPEKEIIATVQSALENGINYFDMAGGHAAIFDAYGKALEGKRDQVYLQVHFGADYTSGEYGWTTDFKKIRNSVQWQLEKLRTDYIDFGFIHCMDAEKSPFGVALEKHQCIWKINHEVTYGNSSASLFSHCRP